VDHVAPLAVCVLGPRSHAVCATCVIPSFDLDLAIWRDDKPVSRASRYIPLATADDKQVITDESEFDPMPVEELKDLRIVVLMHLDPRDDLHCWPPQSASVLINQTVFCLTLPTNSVNSPDASA
jgi:hypothetical protein